MIQKAEFLGVKLPLKLNEEVNRAIDEGHFLNRSELVRVALRELLDEIKREAE